MRSWWSKPGRYHSSMVNSGLWREPLSAARKSLQIWEMGPEPAAKRRFIAYSGEVWRNRFPARMLSIYGVRYRRVTENGCFDLEDAAVSKKPRMRARSSAGRRSASSGAVGCQRSSRLTL